MLTSIRTRCVSERLGRTGHSIAEGRSLTLRFHTLVGHWSLRFAIVLMLVTATAIAEGKPASFGVVVYKAGERFATDEQAGKAIDDFCKYLGGALAEQDANFTRRGVRNAPDDALKLLKDDGKPVALAIVSPGFYFANKDALKLTAIAETKRGNLDGEQYVLIGSTKADNYPAGKRVATTLTAEPQWLNRVVHPKPEDAEAVKWVKYANLFDAAYAIIDKEDDAPDFVLVDRITLEAINRDADLKALKQSAKSAMLPQDVVVEVANRLGEARGPLIKALTTLDASDEGKRIGELIQSPTFQKPNVERLKTAEARWKKE